MKRKKTGSETRSSKKPTDDKYYFDERAADRAVLFIENFVRHPKGEWFGQLFKLEPWQKYHTRQIFGWRSKKTGRRRYRLIFCAVPRKNGKTTWIGGIGTYMLHEDDECELEPGAEIYACAGDRPQAGIIGSMIKKMHELDPILQSRVNVFRDNIVLPEFSSVFKVLSAESATKHGYSPSCVLFDELHVQKNRHLYDTMITGTGARRAPLIFLITTAGYDKDSICYEIYELAKRVKEDPTIDETFYPVIYEAEPDDDWTDPEIWAKANPNLGVSLKREYIEQQCNLAKELPSYENTFKRLHLNIWTEQETRWIPMNKWNECKTFDEADLGYLPCWAGLDLSTVHDMTALVLVYSIDDYYAIKPFFWMPEENIDKRADQDHIPYRKWQKEGLLTLTEGDVIDYRRIREDIMGFYGKNGNKVPGIADKHFIKQIIFDRWNSSQLVQELMDDGAKCFGMSQGFGAISAPSKDFEKLVMEGRIRHNGNQILTWQAGNVCVKSDTNGNIKPVKPKHEARSKRIDGIVALIMGLARAIAEGAKHESVYKKRGIIVL